MGALLKEFRKYVRVNDPAVESILDAALGARNFLMHHFSREREAKLGTEDGRCELIVELGVAGQLLESAVKLVGGMRVAMSRALDKSKDPAGAADSRVLFTMEIEVDD